MRKFIKKLQETNGGSSRLITERELCELKEFVEHRGYRIVATGRNVTVQKVPDHIIQIRLTERDAVKIFKTLNPATFTRKTPRYK